MKKIVVTGGLGFIGSNLIKLLIKKNYFVINIDKITYFFIFHNYLIFLKYYLSRKFVRLFDLFLEQMFF